METQEIFSNLIDLASQAEHNLVHGELADFHLSYELSGKMAFMAEEIGNLIIFYKNIEPIPHLAVVRKLTTLQLCTEIAKFMDYLTLWAAKEDIKEIIPYSKEMSKIASNAVSDLILLN